MTDAAALGEIPARCEARYGNVDRRIDVGRGKMVRPGRRSPGHLHVDGRFSLEQAVLLEQVLANLDKPRRRVLAAEPDPDTVEALLEPLVVESRPRRASR